ncbi:MAG: hypothetical protein J6128_04495 [Clostridia bacterium]|nr:hypothetical protein [Clostridia bacterium]
MRKIEPERPNVIWKYDFWFLAEVIKIKEGPVYGRTFRSVEKVIGRDSDGRLIMKETVNRNSLIPSPVKVTYYELEDGEFQSLLDAAIERGTLSESERRRWTEKAASPFVKSWNINIDTVIFENGRYELGQKDSVPYLRTGGKLITLSCSPYEPMLYIRDENDIVTTVRHAFEPAKVFESFSKGETVTSYTGRTYSPEDFCRLVEYNAGKGNCSIEKAETAFDR